MSIMRMLDQSVVVERIGPGTEDDWGDSEPTVVGRDEYRGRLVPAGFRGGGLPSEEVLVGRDTVLVNEHLWLEPRAVVSATDRVTVDGIPYELIGEPNVLRAPHDVHHIEIGARRIVSG